MAFFKKVNNEVSLYSPCVGDYIPQEKINDQVFSQGLVGKGFAIKPTSNLIYAPVDGTISMIFPTKHAIGFACNGEIECILHVGVDTVNLKGEGFEVCVSEGDVVKAGTLLMKVDFDAIRNSNYHDDVIVVVQNTKSFSITSSLDTVGLKDVIAVCK